MKTLIDRIIAWREKHVKERTFVLFLSFLVGIFTALAAYLLKTFVSLIQTLLTQNFNIQGANYLYLVYPIVGIFIAWAFVYYIVKDDISHGVTKILYFISQRQSRIKRHNIWTSVVASSVTIGFGGSVGAEAPIVLTGSAIGSNLGSLFKMNHKTLQMLIGCGAAGALAAIFKAPIAGVLFTLEVLMLDLTMASVVPLLICAVTATSTSYVLMGANPMFDFVVSEPFAVSRIPYIVLLGLFCGIVSLYFTRGMNWLEDIFRKLNSPYRKMLFGGAVLSVLIFLFPPLYGEGYDTISQLLSKHPENVTGGSFFYGFEDGWKLLFYLALVVIFKVAATCATNGSGGTGGIFAPSLFMGCVSGFVLARGLNLLGITQTLPEDNFALAGMAGVMAGVMHSPLTAIFLIAELTGGYTLFMTLMITATISYITIIFFEPYSLYAMRLAKKGELITHHKDKAVLTMLKMGNVIEKDFQTIAPEQTLGELVKIISTSHRNLYPVVDGGGKLLGIVLLDDIRNIMFRPTLYPRFKVEQLMISPPAYVREDLPMEKVMELFESTNAWNLPVIDKDGKYVGFVSKSKIFNSYRNVLVHFSDE